MTTNSSPKTQTTSLVNAISQRVGCPLPCMGHEETERTYAEILAIVTPLIREQAAKEIEALAAEQQRLIDTYDLDAGEVPPGGPYIRVNAYEKAAAIVRGDAR